MDHTAIKPREQTKRDLRLRRLDHTATKPKERKRKKKKEDKERRKKKEKKKEKKKQIMDPTLHFVQNANFTKYPV